MKKRIILTSNAYFPNIGGIENSLYYLASSYRDMGYEVELVVSDINTVNDSVLPSFEQEGDISIYRYASYQQTSALLRPFRTFLSLFEMYKLLSSRLKIGQPELLVSRFHFNTLIAKFAGFKNIIYLVPGVAKIQNKVNNVRSYSGVLKFKHKLQLEYHSCIQNAAFNAADRLFIFSENMKTQILETTTSQVHLYNTKPGVDQSRFFALRHSEKEQLKRLLGIPVHKKILLMVGRFVKAKGIMFALEAMKELDDYHLVLVGTGEETELYRDFIYHNQLDCSVSIFDAQADVVPFYQCADLFLMLSIYEPFGQTILEAMACQLPVLAFESGGQVQTATSEILSQSEALYVNECSAKAVVEKLMEIRGNLTALASLGVRGRELVVEHYTWERLAQTLKDSLKHN